MTVQELTEILEDLNPDAEVRFASQPSWPFEYSIADAITAEPIDDDDNEQNEDEKESIVYLVEGRQLGYLPGNIRNEIGW